MPTRSGRTFSVGEISAPMDPSIHDTLNTHWQDRKDGPAATKS